MKRRNFFATLLAPILARFAVKPKPDPRWPFEAKYACSVGTGWMDAVIKEACLGDAMGITQRAMPRLYGWDQPQRYVVLDPHDHTRVIMREIWRPSQVPPFVRLDLPSKWPWEDKA